MPKISSKFIVPQYAKGIAKSFKYAAKDIGKELMPSVAENISTNADVLKSVSTNIRSGRTNTKNIMRRVQQSAIGKDFNAIIKNSIDDVKSGNFYNKDRENKMFDEQMGGFDDLGFDTGDENSGLDFSFDDGDEEELEVIVGPAQQVEATMSSAKATINATVASAKGSSLVISSAVKSSAMTNAGTMIEYDREKTAMLMGQEAARHADKMGLLSSMESNVSKMTLFNSENMSHHLEITSKFFDEVSAPIKDIAALIKEDVEMSRNLYKFKMSQYETEERLKKNGESKYDMSSIFGGGVNLGGYGNVLMKNLGDLKDSSGLGMMSGMGEGSMLQMFAGSPMSFIPKMLMMSMIPSAVSGGMKKLNKTFGNLFSSYIGKMNGMADSDNPIMSGLGKLLGAKDYSRKSLNLGNYNKGIKSFDGITHKTINEVLPHYLSVIAAGVTGGEVKTYDHKTGKFKTVDTIKSEYNSEVGSTLNSSVMTYKDEMMTGLQPILDKLGNSEDVKDVRADVDTLLKHYVEKGKFFNVGKIKNIDDMPIDLKSGEEGFNLIKAALESTSYGDRMQFQDEINRYAGTNAARLKSIETSDENTAYRSLFNGLNSPKGLSNDINSVNGQTGSILNKIYERLTKGIITFQGNGIPAELTKSISSLGGVPGNPNNDNSRYRTTPNSPDRVKMSDLIDLPSDVKELSELMKKEQTKRAEYENRGTLLNRKLKNSKLGKKFAGSKLGKAASNATDKMSDMMNTLDKKTYETMYGSDDEDGDGNTPSIDKYKKRFSNLGDSIKGKASSFSSGLISGVTSQFGFIVPLMNKMVITPLSKSLFGENGLFTKGKKFFNTNFIEKGSEYMDSIKSKLFGQSKDGKSDTGGMLSKYGFTPKSFMGSLGGLGASALLFKTGNPLLGMVGASASFISGSEKFKTSLFGKTDENGEREGGKISKDTLNTIKAGAPRGLLGFVGGKLFGNLLLGPAGGVIAPYLGAGIGFASGSEKFKNSLFGEVGEDGERQGGKISKAQQKFLKGAMPKGLLGMIGGKMALGSLFPSFGIAAPLLGAVGGLSMGIYSQTDKFKTYMFGEEDPEDGKRKGGLVGNVKTWMFDKVLNPLKGWMDKTHVNMKDWFKSSISNPFKEALVPLKKEFSVLTDKMKDMFSDGWVAVQNTVSGVFEKSVGKPFGEIMEEKVLNPLKGFLSKLMGGLGKMAGSILSSPVKGLTSIALSLSGADDKDKSKLAKDNKDFIGTLDSDSDKAKTKFFTRISKKYGGIKNLFNHKLIENAGMMSTVNSVFSDMFGSKKSKDDSVNLKDKFKDMREGLTNKIGGLAAIGSVPSMKELFKFNMSYAKDSVSDKARYAKNAISDGSNNVKSALTNGKNSIMDKAMSTKDTVTESIRNSKNSIMDKVDIAKKNSDKISNRKKKSDSNAMTGKESSRFFDIVRENTPKQTGFLRKISKEVSGQLDGVGHNLETIKNILTTHLGPSDIATNTLGGTRGNKKRKGFMGKILDIIKSPFDMAKDILMKPLNMAKENVLSFGKGLGKAGKLVLKLPLQLGKAALKIGETVLNTTNATMKVMGELGKQTIKTVGNTIYKATDALMELPKHMITGVSKIIGKATDAIADTIKPLGGIVKNVATGLMNLTKVIPDVLKGLADMGGMLIKGITTLTRGLGGLGLNAMGKIPGMDKVLKKQKSVYITGGTLDLVKTVNGVKGVGPEFASDNATGYLSLKAKKLKAKKENSALLMSDNIAKMTENSDKSLSLMSGLNKGKSMLEKLGMTGVASIVVTALTTLGIGGSMYTGNNERATTLTARLGLKYGKKLLKGVSKVTKGSKSLIKGGSKVAKRLIPKGVKGASKNIFNMVKKVLFNPKLLEKIGGKKVATAIVSKALPKIIKRAGIATAKIVGKIAGLPLFVLYDLSTGFAEAKRIFKIPSDSKASFKMRIASGLGKCINGLLLGLVEVGQSLLDPDNADWITMLIYEAIANVEEENELKALQSDMKKDLAEYNAKHGTNLSVSEYNDKTNKSIFNKALDLPNQIKGLYSKGKDKVAGLWNSGKDKLSKEWDMLKGTAKDLKEYAIDKYAVVLEKVTGTLTSVKDGFLDSLTGIKDTIVEKFIGFTSMVEEFPGKLATKLTKSIEELTTKVTDKIENVLDIGNNVKDKVVNTYSNVKDTVRSKYNNFKDRFGFGGEFGQGKGDVFYSQKDSRWGSNSFTVPGDISKTTISDSGCGPTAMAMAVSSITGRKVTPDYAASYAEAGGYKEPNDGTNFQFFTDYAKSSGVTSRQVSITNKDSITDVINTIKSGARVILMGKDTSGGTGSPFGKSPHYVLVTEIDGEDMFIHDPLKTSGNNKYKVNNVFRCATHAIILGEKSKMNANSIWAALMKIFTGSSPESKLNKSFNGELAWGAKTNKAFNTKVLSVSKSLGIDPNHLMSVMAFESGGSFSPSKRNPVSGATGLIQFMEPTAKSLGTSQSELSKMSDVQQLDYVEKYLKTYKGKISSGNLEDLYASVLYPKSLYNEDGYMFKSPSKEYRQNRGLDSNDDGSIDKYEAAIKIREKLEEGMKHSTAMSFEDMSMYGSGAFDLINDIQKKTNGYSSKSRSMKNTLNRFKNISKDVNKIKYKNKSGDSLGSIAGVTNAVKSGSRLLSGKSRDIKSLGRSFGKDVNTDGIDVLVKSTNSLTNDISRTVNKGKSVNKSIDNIKDTSSNALALAGASNLIDKVTSSNKDKSNPVETVAKTSTATSNKELLKQTQLMSKMLETLLIIAGNTESLDKLRAGGINALMSGGETNRPNIAAINGGENIDGYSGLIANGIR